MTMLRDNAGHVQLTDDQFNKLVELLTPGYECSKLMLAELQSRAPQPDTAPVWKPTGEKPWSDGDNLKVEQEPSDPNISTGEKSNPLAAPVGDIAAEHQAETHEITGS